MGKENELIFDLQRFADDGNSSDAGDAGDKTVADGGKDNARDAGKSEADKADGNGKAGTPTEAEIQLRIAQELAAAKEKWEKDFKKKADAEKREQERLSKLSEDERRKAELENSQRELEAREKELARKELKLEMVKVLADRKIPVQFMDYLIADDNESTMTRITTFEKAYKKAIEDGVNEKLKGKIPKTGDSSDKAPSGAGSRSSFFEAIYRNQSKR